MFDIGFWELVLISVVALVVLGPERLPTAIRSVSSFIRTAKTMANNVKDELSHELKVQELQENLKKAEKMGMDDLSPDLQRSVDELKQAAKEVTRPYASANNKATSDSSSEPLSQNESASSQPVMQTSQDDPKGATKSE